MVLLWGWALGARDGIEISCGDALREIAGRPRRSKPEPPCASEYPALSNTSSPAEVSDTCTWTALW